MSRYHKAAKWTGDVVVLARRIWTKRMQEAQRIGKPYICPKCEVAVTTDQVWDVGHQEDIYEGGSVFDLSKTTPEHANCNRSAGAHITNQIKRQKRGRTRQWL